MSSTWRQDLRRIERDTWRAVPAAAVVLFSVVALAQSPQKAAPKHSAPAVHKAAGATPSFEGIWKTMGQPLDFNNIKGPGLAAGKSKNWYGKTFQGGGYGFLDGKMEEPQMLPWAQAKYKAIRQGAYDYLQPVKNVEPFLNCLPGSVPWVYDRGDPFEIIQTPSKVIMLFENDGHWRQIFLDGRKNPDGAPDTFMGYSTGHWEGDTLVVETVGLNNMSWIDRLGHPHSDALKMEERIRRVALDRLDIDFVFDDPKTYVKPWKGKKVFRPEKSDFAETFACEDTWREEYPEKLRKEIGDLKGP